MEHFYLLDTLAKSEKYDARLLDYLKYELDQRIYSYGDQFRFPREGSRKAIPFKGRIRKLGGTLLKRQKIKYARKDEVSGARKIVSNAYFTVNDELRHYGYMVYSPHWGNSPDSAFLPDVGLFKAYIKLREVMEGASFVDLLSERTSVAVNTFAESSRRAYQVINVAALVVPNDMNVWERIAIQQFKEMGRPSFTFLHGLPGRYNHLDESRTDYLVVWGEKIKENYVKAGHDPKRIFVSGHPYYKCLTNKESSHSLDNILVLTKSMNGAQHSGDVILSDRGNLITYLYSIQQALTSIGVRKVRLRPHPSENGSWYFKYIDREFFLLDTENLVKSLNKSSLVIGPTSTMMLESLYHGVHYQVYEPVEEGRCMDNYPAVPPFDGSDSRVSIAKNEEELLLLLRENRGINPSFWGDYINPPFDLSFMRGLI